MSERRKRHNKLRNNICERCGAPYQTYSNHAEYCPDCRKVRAKEHARERYLATRTINPVEKAKMTTKAESCAAGYIPACPFWDERKLGIAVGCEDGTLTLFETKQERAEFIAERCSKNPDWRKCPIARELLIKYKD